MALMIPPEHYAIDWKYKTYQELKNERDRLLEEVKKFENPNSALYNSHILCSLSPQMKYEWKLDVLGYICKFMSRKYNIENGGGRFEIEYVKFKDINGDILEFNKNIFSYYVSQTNMRFDNLPTPIDFYDKMWLLSRKLYEEKDDEICNKQFYWEYSDKEEAHETYTIKGTRIDGNGYYGVKSYLTWLGRFWMNLHEGNYVK